MDDAISLGAFATATHKNSIAIGSFSTTEAENEVSFGNKNLKRKLVNVAKGTDDTDAVTLANLNEKFANTIKLENNYFNAKDNKISNLAAGTNDTDAVTYSQLIRGNATGQDSLAYGDKSIAAGKRSTVVGVEATSGNTDDAVAIGYKANAGYGAVAVGSGAKAGWRNSIAIGYDAATAAEESIAIGVSAHAKHKASVAIGSHSTTEAENEVSFGNKNLKRKLVNVAKGIGDTDVATIANLNEKFANALKLNNNVFDANYKKISNVAKGEEYNDVATMANLTESLSKALTHDGEVFDAKGKVIKNVAKGTQNDHVATIANLTDSEKKINEKIDKSNKEINQTLNQTVDTALDDEREKIKKQTTELVTNLAKKEYTANNLSKTFSPTIHKAVEDKFNKSLTLNDQGVFIAQNKKISNLADADINANADAINVRTAKSLIIQEINKRLGAINEQSANGSLVIGSDIHTDHTTNIAIGNKSIARGKNSLAFGNDANAQAGGIAIGNNSFANGNVVSFGKKGLERRLTNVDKGINDTDAATLANLNEKFKDTLFVDGTGNFDARRKKISNIKEGTEDGDVATIANINKAKEGLEHIINNKLNNETIILNGKDFDAKNKKIYNVKEGTEDGDVATIANINKAKEGLEHIINNKLNNETIILNGKDFDAKNKKNI
ncbi:hypothetical protein [Bartonella sp. DGB1]|uniref:hypothetical protein n=1 Tax=Bartonella sp. DGB1 TaxID=3239807 RepID=UPI003525ED24